MDINPHATGLNSDCPSDCISAVTTACCGRVRLPCHCPSRGGEAEASLENADKRGLCYGVMSHSERWIRLVREPPSPLFPIMCWSVEQDLFPLRGSSGKESHLAWEAPKSLRSALPARDEGQHLHTVLFQPGLKNFDLQNVKSTRLQRKAISSLALQHLSNGLQCYALYPWECGLLSATGRRSPAPGQPHHSLAPWESGSLR